MIAVDTSVWIAFFRGSPDVGPSMDRLLDRGVCDGASVYACTSADEVIDLVQGGQGVFGIAVGRVWREVEGTLAQLPSERADEETPAAHPGDELTARRLRKTS